MIIFTSDNIAKIIIASNGLMLKAHYHMIASSAILYKLLNESRHYSKTYIEDIITPVDGN